MAIDPYDASVTHALNAWRVQYEAGLPLEASLTTASELTGAPAQAAFQEAAVLASTGAGIEELLDSLAPALPPTDRALLAAGWNSGRADSVMRAVVERREVWGRAQREFKTKMVFPLAILFLAAWIAPAPKFIIHGGLAEYLISVFLPLGIVVGLLLILRAAIRNRAMARVQAGEDTPLPADGIDRLIVKLPILAGLTHRRNRAELATLLGMQLEAGITMLVAMRSTAASLPSGLYREAVGRLAEVVRSGRTVTEGMDAEPQFWERTFRGMVNSAETSGALAEAFIRMGRNEHEGYARSLGELATWLPRVAYALVCVFIIYNIFTMAAGVPRP